MGGGGSRALQGEWGFSDVVLQVAGHLPAGGPGEPERQAEHPESGSGAGGEPEAEEAIGGAAADQRGAKKLYQLEGKGS